MSEFVDYLHEVFAVFGTIHARRMFGGYGLYHEGVMFALVADDTLYLKANAQTAGYFKKLDLPPFEYRKGDQTVKMSYYLAPDSMMDDPEEAVIWARRAYDAALASAKAKTLEV